MNVSLRRVSEDDLPLFFEHQRDPVACRMAAFEPREETAFLEHWRTNVLGDPTVYKKTVVVDGQVAGNVLCFVRNGKREVGYWLAREFWGRGIATEALRLFLRDVTERPLHAVVASHNAGSIRVLEKCGFTAEGVENEQDVVVKLEASAARTRG